MKRKILIAAVALAVMATGTAYAAGKSVSVLVNGKPVQSGQVIDGSTMLPLRAVAEALGAKVDWDGTKWQASVTMPQAPAQTAQAGLTLAQLNKIGESVGIIYAYAGDKLVSQGSGFVVDGDVFVTNWHVVDQGVDTLDVRFADKQVIVKVADALFKDEKADLVGFKVDGISPLTLNTAEPKAGDKVYDLGYPNDKFQITEGSITSTVPQVGLILHSAHTDHGASGGILINSSGEVIGINSKGDETGANYSIAASVLANELGEVK